MTITAQRTIPRRALRPSLNGPGLATTAAIIALWELGARSGVLSSFNVPAPSSVAAAWGRLADSGQLQSSVAHTLAATFVGWAIAAAIGIVLGTIMGLSRIVYGFTAATVEVLRAVPAISFVPLSVLLLGFSMKMEVVIIVYVSAWPVLINTLAGVRSVTVMHEDVARTMQLSFIEKLRKITMPSAVPNMLVGLRLALALSLMLAVVAEMVSNPHGIGYELTVAQQAVRPAEMYAYIVLTGIIGVVLNALFVRLTELAAPGMTRAQGRAGR